MTTTAQHASPSAPPQKQIRFARPAKNEGRVVNLFSHGFLALWGLMVGIPLLWATVQSFRSDDEILHNPLSLPSHWHVDAFGRAWTKGHIGDYFLNTLIVLIPSVTLTMLFGSMVAYVLARYPFRGNRFIYYLFFTGLVMPIFLGLIPLYLTVKNLAASLGLESVIGLNTYGGLILVYIAYSLPFTVFFMHSFFRTLPSSVAEAGLIDGASHTTLFFRVMLPMARPGLVSIGLFNIIGQWNQFILPNLLMKPQSGFDSDRSMLTQGLLALVNNSKYETDWARLFAGMTIAMLPILITYLALNRQIQAGLTGSVSK
ncbi:carbohydrate ABC transporter permease [Hamadaea tsunoensis]|uniref:carbohydrate ABC transporter permease n=1 Tax=Hamadaea tsunoensis TaxID=53368 RepID=UPI00041A4FA5|nr:carbohydrate ABC transporter permease [Hamadaea tsunoensis]